MDDQHLGRRGPPPGSAHGDAIDEETGARLCHGRIFVATARGPPKLEHQVDIWLRLSIGCATMGGVSTSDLGRLVQMTPRDAAARLAGAADEAWARDFLEEFDRRVRTDPVGRLAARWRLSNTEIGRMFGVSRQAVAKWMAEGAPADRQARLAELDAATELLERYVRPERIPAVVRRPSEMTGGKSLLELASEGRSAEVLEAVRAMLDLRRVQP